MKIKEKQPAEGGKDIPLQSTPPSDTFAFFYAEETLLGTLLNCCPLSDQTPVLMCFEFLGSSDFQDTEHQLLFSAIKNVFQKTGRILPADVIKLLRKEFVNKKVSVELFSRLANVIVFNGDLSLLIYEIKKTSILHTIKQSFHEKLNSEDEVDTIGLITQLQSLLSEKKETLLQLDERLLNGK
jgi:hypothetical protein